MITVRLIGGLGNQMFQFAAAYALARRRGCDVAIDISKLDRGRLSSFLLGKADPDTKRPYLLDRLNLPPTVRRRYRAVNKLRRLVGMERIYREPHFHFDEAFFDLECPITLSGYFQSERYFAGIADEVRTMFTLKAQPSAGARQAAAAIAASPAAVALHVRRGDFIANPDAAKYHTLLDIGFYRQALGIMRERLGAEPEVFLFSDDPVHVEQAFSFVGSRRVIRGNDGRPWEDMALMARCRHHITANSSFSWWGAWLARHPDQIVVAPRNWFKGAGAENSNLKDFYPSGWTVI